MEERLQLRRLKKRDLMLLLILCAIAVGLMLWFWFGHQERGVVVEVTVDGEVFGTYPLDEEQEIWIDSQAREPGKSSAASQEGKSSADGQEGKSSLGGQEPGKSSADGGAGNRLLISNQTANMVWADCPDQICVHQAPISHVGETIICLPNRVVVTIVGDSAPALDTSVR